MDGYEKKWIWGQKTAFLTKNSAFFYATPMKPSFFWLGRSRLNGMTTPPYPEVTLDTFGILVCGRLAARRAVFWPQLPKIALFGSKNDVFWPEINFCGHRPFFFGTIMTGHQKDNIFVLIMLLDKLLGGFKGHFWPKIGPQSCFFTLHPYNPHFWGSDGPGSMGS